MSKIPVVIFHFGNQKYLEKCVEINSKKNFVYLIGNDTNENLFKNNKNVKHIHVKNLDNGEVNRLKRCFVNYSTHDVSYEIKCFLRVFYLKQLMLTTGINTFFHLDSDCIVFEKIEDIFSSHENINNAYSLQKFSQEKNPYHMVGCIHNGLINIELCNKFINLCFDIYENKSKMDLINSKILFHKIRKIGGGICDMTIFYLLFSEKMCEVFDLNEKLLVNGEDCVFDHNVNDSYGFLGEDTYKMENGIKKIIKNDDKFYFFTNDDKLVRALSIHYQGGAKNLLENL